MADMAEEVTIAAGSDLVWSVLSEFEGISTWAPNVDHSCLTSHESGGVGAERRVQVGRNALLERVVTWEPNQCLAYTIVGLPPVVSSVANTWTLEDAGASTNVTLSSRIAPAGPRPPQQVAARVFGRVLAKASREMLTGLKRHVEGMER